VCQSTVNPKGTSTVFLVLQAAAIAQFQRHGDAGAGNITAILLSTASTWGEKEGRPK